ncbi:MAG: XtrA/YqaO family protein [Solibacillus sp.]
MRMQELEINVEGKLYIDIMDLPDSCVIVLSNGKAKVAELPAFAETKIVTHQGQVKRIRWDEGEEF